MEAIEISVDNVQHISRCDSSGYLHVLSFMFTFWNSYSVVQYLLGARLIGVPLLGNWDTNIDALQGTVDRL